jgi:hypothetical protein
MMSSSASSASLSRDQGNARRARAIRPGDDLIASLSGLPLVQADRTPGSHGLGVGAVTDR